jgi:hypothetical protein
MLWYAAGRSAEGATKLERDGFVRDGRAGAMKHVVVGYLAIVLAAFACAPSEQASEEAAAKESAPMKEPPFGGAADMAYAMELWNHMEEMDFNSVPGVLQPGQSPHGSVVEIIEGTIGGNTVIAKRNYAGEGITVEDVEADRAMYLAAVTVMAKREPGYDPENSDWFWVKYQPDGTVDKNPEGMGLAGRVAKGMEAGCIACHKSAAASDMVFSYAEDSGLEVTYLEEEGMEEEGMEGGE